MLYQRGDKMTEYTISPDPSDPVLFDSRGARRTASLFLETTRDSNMPPVLTLMDYNKNGLPSAYLIYMESETEYDAAMKIVGSMNHWRKLTATPWFLNGDPDRGFTGLEQWRRDMAMRDANMAMSILRSRVADGDQKSAQFLLTYATKGQIAGGTDNKTKKPNVKAVKKDNVTSLTELKKQLTQVPK